MGEDQSQSHAAVPTELDSLLRQALTTQQPFYTALLNQISGIEHRQGKYANDLMIVRDMAHQLLNQELLKKHYILEQRIKVLEDERQQRRGVRDATEWVPKVIQWLVILIVGVMVYLKADIKIP